MKRQIIVNTRAPQLAPPVSGADVLLVDEDLIDLEYHYDLLQSQSHKTVVSQAMIPLRTA